MDQTLWTIPYAIDDNQYIRFNLAHLTHTEIGRRAARSVRCSMPIVSLCALLLLYIAGAQRRLFVAETCMLGIVNIVWQILANKILALRVKRSVRRQKKTGRLPYSERGTLYFDREEVRDVTPLRESKLRYEMFEKAWVTPDALYLYFSAVQAVIVPVVCLRDEAEKQALVSFLSEKIPVMQTYK